MLRRVDMRAGMVAHVSDVTAEENAYPSASRFSSWVVNGAMITIGWFGSRAILWWISRLRSISRMRWFLCGAPPRFSRRRSRVR